MAEGKKGRRYKMSELEERVETWHRLVWKTSLKSETWAQTWRKWGASCAGIKGGVLQAEGRAAWTHWLKDMATPRSACGIRSHSSHDLDKHLEYRLTGPLNNMKSDRIGWGSQKILTGRSKRLNGRIWNTTGMNVRGMPLIQNINSTALDEERHGSYMSKESPGMFHIRKADNTISIYFFLFFQTSKFLFRKRVVLEKTLESVLDCKEIKLKENQPWIFIGRTDAKAEAPKLWPPDAKNWLIGKDPDAGKDWRQKEEGDIGWDGWIASPTQWTWIWANSRI